MVEKKMPCKLFGQWGEKKKVANLTKRLRKQKRVK